MKIKLLLFFLFIGFSLLAQYTVKGVILDSYNQSLPFVNVMVKGSEEGVTSNDNGEFSISCNGNSVLEVSFMGFETQFIKVTSGKKILKIILKEEVSTFDPVVVVTKPKKRLKKEENPAYKILKEFWKRNHSMGVDLSDSYEYKTHSYTEVGLNNVDTTFIKRLFNEQFDEAMKEIKYDSDGTNYYLPINIKEKVLKVYGNNKTNKKRVDIEAERTEGLSSKGFVFDRMSNTFVDFNVFDNTINLLRKPFVSPLSTKGFATYDYLLYDSIVKNDNKLYNIYFFPRRNSDFAFQGNVWISDKNYSLNKLKMKVTKQSGINFVRGLVIEKNFEFKDGFYIPKKDIYEGDFTLLDKKDDNKGVTIKRIDDFTNYNFKRSHTDDFYLVKKKKVRPNQYKKNDFYWDSKASIASQETYKLIKSVKEKRKIRNITQSINVLATGFFSLSKLPIQVGEIWNFLNYNQVEGYRTQLTLRTFKTKDDRFAADAFIAYGFKDNKFKFGVDGEYVLSYVPRITIGTGYKSDIEQLGRFFMNGSGIKNRTGSSLIIARGNNYFLSKVEKYSANIDYSLSQNFKFGLCISKGNISSAAAKDKFSIDYLDGNSVKNNVTDVASDFYLHYTPKRIVYGLGARQRSSRKWFSSYMLNFRRGYKGFFGGSHDYNKIQFRVVKPIVFGSFGVTKTTFDVGKTFGQVPISLLNPIPANQSYSISPTTFSLMNYYDYVTDTYASLHLEHHFNGFFLNKIPLLDILKLRSLLTFRAAYGGISDKNRSINKSTIDYVAPNNRPYYEYGVGIENIGFGNLRMFRVDAIWRGDYQPSFNSITEPTSKFAIRIGISPGI